MPQDADPPAAGGKPARAAALPRTESKQSRAGAYTAGRQIVILHFNDVYEIEPRARDPAGGVSRFTAKLRAHARDRPLTLFSGDFLAPSLLSTTTLGAHMVQFFNRMDIKAACLGNHDFDHGIDVCRARMAESNFPYLLSNAVHARTGEPLAGARRWAVVDHEGVRVGLMGLIEEEWLATLTCLEPGDVRYTDYAETARELEPFLRARGCDLVVALTHSRSPNDERLAREAPGLDLILGGHDHDVYRRVVAGTPVIKSGTDFRELTRVVVTLGEGPARPDGGPRRPAVEWSAVPVLAADPVDREAEAMVREYNEGLAKTMDVVVGAAGTDLDFRFARIRTGETSGANWVADEMLRAGQAHGAHAALVNSGTLRADDVLPAGPLRVRDLNNLLPMLDELCVVALTGAQLLEALENGVSQWPKHEGRFPAVAGIRFAFDGRRAPGRRVDVGSCTVRGRPLDLDEEYRLVTKNYLRSGRDGYDVFTRVRLVADSEYVPLLPVLVREAVKRGEPVCAAEDGRVRNLTKAGAPAADW